MNPILEDKDKAYGLRETLTLRRALQQGAARLSRDGIESAAVDCEALLRHLRGLERADFYLSLDDKLGLEEERRFRRLLERRAAREPLAYITGLKEFWSLDFIVSPAVLIPRPETELLVELALDHAHRLFGRERIKILDIGSGSGAIAVSLAKDLAAAEICAVDISLASLSIAEANAKRHGVREGVHFLHGDLFDALGEEKMMFDVIVSNPPYIRRAEIAGLAPEIRKWEPLAALDGGVDGLEFYRRIIRKAPRHLAEGGRMLLEVGSDMAEAIVNIFARAGCYGTATVHRDYSGRDRVVTAVRGTRSG
jgi:release factor glutamine methyltransferase